ncbi:prostaglandin reductase 1-like [Schistocerca gregaria]|uniref:prostaglandin reductase 1-like n=1 Tax=Schistocerca gregaria TaxID=7010 RepID=UPI00211ECB9D|nr:prostaglandin reductase 1-like [Schistocerca gregaria]
MAGARKLVIARPLGTEPLPEDFCLQEEELPPLRDGQILVEALYISLDPFEWAFKHLHKVGATMIGSQLARVVESRSAAFPAGRLVVGCFGWRDRTVTDVGPRAHLPLWPPVLLPRDLGGLPPSLALGALGMPGYAAYFGLIDVCDPRPGDVVVVSGAGGAVGSLAGQIARIHGCTAVGLVRSDEKVRWLTEELGFEHAFNYQTSDVRAALRRVAPGGVDVYFDTVGGDLSSAVADCMRERGRIAVCGCVSTYRDPRPPKMLLIPPAVVRKRLRMDGFMFTQWRDRWPEADERMALWIRQGRLKWRETLTDGFLNTPQAFAAMLRGDAIGKALVKV